MTKQVQRRRGTATQHTSFTGAEGELSVNTTNKSVHVHDGSTAGGIELARKDGSNVAFTSGTLDGVTIGGTTAGAGTFTNLTATGTTTLAGASTSANITFGDNDKAIFGAGNDLQIYHDGSNSIINETGTGNLALRASAGVYIQKYDGTEDLATFLHDDGVYLYHNNSLKFKTTSTGVDISGSITADGLTVSDTQASGGVGIDIINVGDGGISTTPYTYIASKLNPTRNGGEIRFTRANTYGSAVQADANIELYTTVDDVNKLALKVHSGGDISFYEDTGTTAKFFWDASAESLGIGTSSPATSISGSAKGLAIQDSNVPFLSLDNTGTSGRRYSLYSNTGGSLVTYDEDAASTRMVIDSSGNVGIGTSSPSHLIDGRLSGTSSGEVISVGNATNGFFGGIAISDGGTYPVRYWGSSLEFYTGNSTYSSATERMRITSSGNVGIGTSSPQGAAHVKGETAALGVDDYPQLTIETAATSGAANTGGGILFLNHDGTGGSFGGSIQSLKENGTSGNSAHYMRFSTRANGGNVTERMRIDSSGNLLVGKTSSDAGTFGTELRSSGVPLVSTSDNANTANFNRKTSDGTIINLQKDGTTVGSIGSSASGQYLHIGSGDTGITFAPNVDSIIPFNVGTGAYNANVDLGYSAGTKFRNIYLNSGVYVDSGGGVYLGGTGSANKLDDYEEGTWTPTLKFGGNAVGQSYSVQSGYYTKVGRIVILSFNVNLSNKGTSTGQATIDGSPFAQFASTQFWGGQLIFEGGGVSANNVNNYAMPWSDGNLYLRYQDSTQYAALSDSNFSNTTRIFSTCIFQVN